MTYSPLFARILCPLFLFVLMTTAACGGDEGNQDTPDAGDSNDAAPDAPPLSPSCQEATQHSDLAWIQEEIFTKSCAAFSACHQGNNPAGGLTLEVGLAEAAMVNVDSKLFPDRKLIVPGSAADSYLMVIVGHPNSPGPIDENVGTMPLNNPLLCREKLDAMERWVDSL